MGKGEPKTCARCGNSFECKAGNIGECECSRIALTAEQRELIGEKYDDCLCVACLLQLKNERIDNEDH